MKLREGIKEGAERIRKKKLAEFVLRELERRSAERAEKELQWRLNICFEKGDQYCDAVWPAGEIYRQEKQYYWQEREVFNHIAPIIEARLARLSQVRPLMMVRPASGDDSDRQNAQLCTNLLHSVYYKLDMQEKLKQATQWSELCGSAFYKVTWDAEAECGGVRCGDISVTVCPAFEIYPDSCASPGVDRCRSISKKYGVSKHVLARINNGLKNSQLSEGKYIIICKGDVAGEEQKDGKSTAAAAEGKKEDKKNGQLERRELTKEELKRLALEEVGDNSNRLEGLRLGKESSLMKLDNRKKRETEDHEATVRELERELAKDKGEFMQDAIKQGISRSSIVKSVGQQLEEEKGQKQEESRRKLDSMLSELDGTRDMLLKQYRNDVEAAKLQYEKALRAAQERLETKNNAANDKIDAYNGDIPEEAGYALVQGLLGTLGKKTAKEYLQGNETKLRGSWGNRLYDRLLERYR